MKNSILFSISREEVTWGYPFSLFMHYGLNRLVLVFNTLLLIRHGIASSRKQLEEKETVQIQCIPVHRTLLTAQLDLCCPWLPRRHFWSPGSHASDTGETRSCQQYGRDGEVGRAMGQISLYEPLTTLCSAPMDGFVPHQPRRPWAPQPELLPAAHAWLAVTCNPGQFSPTFLQITSVERIWFLTKCEYFT